MPDDVIHVRFIGLSAKTVYLPFIWSKSRHFIWLQTSNENVLLRAFSTIGIFPQCRAMCGWNRQNDLDEGRPWCIMGQEGVFGSVEGRNLMLVCFIAYTDYYWAICIICFYIERYLHWKIMGYWTRYMIWIATWKSYLPRPRSLKSLNPLSRFSFICKIWDRPGYVSDSEQRNF